MRHESQPYITINVLTLRMIWQFCRQHPPTMTSESLQDWHVYNCNRNILAE